MGIGLSFLISLLIGALAGLGVGSGGLYLVYLDLFTDTPQHEAQGLNLAFFVFALLSSVIVSFFRGAYREKRLLLLLPTGMLGALSGALCSGLVPAAAAKKLLGVVFLLAGGYTVISTLVSFLQKKRQAALDKKAESEYNNSI